MSIVIVLCGYNSIKSQLNKQPELLLGYLLSTRSMSIPISCFFFVNWSNWQLPPFVFRGVRQSKTIHWIPQLRLYVYYENETHNGFYTLKVSVYLETTNNTYLVGFSYSTKEMPIISYNNVLLKVMMRKQHPKSGKTTIFQLRFDFPFRKSVIDYSKVMHCYYVMLCLIYFVSICCFCM